MGLNAEPGGGMKVLIALSNFEAHEKGRFSDVEKLCRDKYAASICFAARTFDEFILAVSSLKQLPKNLSDAVSDLKDYLNDQGLLSEWTDWMDVVNCAQHYDWIKTHGIYACPSSGGAYNHDRCRFFGMYRNKKVELIAQIEAVVEIDANDNALVRWNNVAGEKNDAALIKLALERFKAVRDTPWEARVFVLGESIETDFIKDSPGGMFGSKMYVCIEKLKAESTVDLARKLNGRKWSEFR